MRLGCIVGSFSEVIGPPMQSLAVVILLWAGAAPDSARFVLRLRGIPVGFVELSLNGDAYTYRSTHMFRNGGGAQRTRVRSETIALRPDGPAHESLWLWKRPAQVGCVEGRAEINGTFGELCAETVAGDQVTGSVFGRAFRARYDDAGLVSLKMEGVSFERVGRGVTVNAPELFSKGVEIRGSSGPAALDPRPRPTGRCDALTPAKGVSLGKVEAMESDSCLTIARRAQRDLAQRGVVAGIVHGFLLDGARARPHAWIRLDGRDFDPTLGTPVDEGRTHLSLTCARSAADDAAVGEAWMKVLLGEVRVVRK